MDRPEIRSLEEADLEAVLAIYNDAVLTQTSIWNDDPTSLAERRNWWQGRREKNYPVLVAARGGSVAGYGSFGDFRPFQGYRLTVEHSIYVAPAYWRQGVGTLLLQRLIQEARALGKHVMVGAIDAGNEASLRLHARLGFVETARMPELGFKFGRPLDLVLMQKQL